MSDSKYLNSILKSSKVLHIGEKTTFKKIFRKILNKKQLDFVLVDKPQPNQMSSVLATKLLGKKFLWVQSFENPPVPGFYTRLLLNQTDTILVSSKKMASKLHKFGVDKPKIRVVPKPLLKQPKA